MHRRYRSFFWPLVLIVIGVFALLADLNVISTDRLYRLADLWPLILIVIGLELIARRVFHGAAIDIAAALVLLIAAGGAIAYVSVGPAIPGGTHSLDAADEVGTLSSATLDLNVGAADVTVVGNSSLGPDLYRAHIEYSGSKPSVTLDTTGDLRISQESGFSFFSNRHFVLNLQISQKVSWTINVTSGAVNGTFKLTHINVSSMEFNAGAGREDMTLGPPKGVVPITFSGGAVTLLVHRPSGTEASAHVSGGAVNLTGDGHRSSGIGSLDWQSDGYDTATDAYRIEVSAGAGTVTVDSTAPAD